MFEGEMASLTAILKTGTVKVPKPIKVLDAPGGGSMLVMEHLDMRYLSRFVCFTFISGCLCSFSEWEACIWGYNFAGCDRRDP